VLELLMILEFLILFALAAVSPLAGISANQLKYAVFAGKYVKWWRRSARIGALACLTLVFLWLAVTLLIWSLFGWLFVIDRITVMLLLFAALVPGAACFALTKRNIFESFRAKSAAWLLASVQTMPIAAWIAFYLVLADVPALPDARELSLYLVVVIVCAAAIWLYQTRRLAGRRLPRLAVRLFRGAVLTAVLFAALFGAFVWSLEKSKFPATMAMVDHEAADFGGGTKFALVPMHAGSVHGHDGHAVHGREGSDVHVDHTGHGHEEHNGHSDDVHVGRVVSVSDLTGPKEGEPDKRFTLIAEKRTVRLDSGAVVEAWTFNGQIPGPQLVVNEGDLVEVRLVNKNIEQGVTLHWHGVDVPNAEDGVAGMTQDAVPPGASHTYRFVVNETGTHWYHSHQVSSVQVKKGLFGPLIILPKGETPADSTSDMTVFAHEWETDGGTVTALDLSDTFQAKQVRPGTEVRLRLVNSSSNTKVFSVNGTPYRVAAIDGNDIHEPGLLTDRLLKIGGGGRYDVVFTMPETPVTLALISGGAQAGIVFSKDGRGTPEALRQGDMFDPTRYGAPAPSPFNGVTRFDRNFTMILDQVYIGNYNGKTGQLWAINGEVFPNVPTFMVQEGDLVKTTIVNRSFSDHPMHLHGHHIHVLSKNGEPLRHSPLVLDTLLVDPGETYEVAFVADNPGLWMDHCHNLDHAAMGMSMHLAYERVTTPFRIGGEAGNHPE